jgi:hypothetical protein
MFVILMISAALTYTYGPSVISAGWTIFGAMMALFIVGFGGSAGPDSRIRRPAW